MLVAPTWKRIGRSADRPRSAGQSPAAARAATLSPMPNLTVIIASTRPGRAGLPIGTWFAERARAHAGFHVTVADLAAIDLPLFNEPEHPRLRRYRHRHTRDWSALVEAADAFVMVTPEYNHGYPAPLKNAIDYLHEEWTGKPVGFVSYGGVAAGTRAVEQLKPVITAVGMLPVVSAVHIPFFPQFLEGDELRPNAIMEQSADAMLDELGRTEALLRPQQSRPRAA
jgi:NAD(P)H-dependent FMN reductase